MHSMENRDVKELVALAVKNRLGHADVAAHLGITASYWSNIRGGKKPLTRDVHQKVRDLKERLRAFSRAS